MQNTKLLDLLSKKNVTLYKLSEETGIPYTNLNKLKNGIQDINNCSVKDIYKLALYFGCTIEDLLNPISYLTNTHGRYKKYKYRWEQAEDVNVLQICDDNSYFCIDYIPVQSSKKNYIAKKALTEAIIENYIIQKESEEAIDEKVLSNAQG